jgi:hypothetical protein
MTEEVLQVELTDKANEAVAFILEHNLSRTEAETKLRGKGYSAEDIRSALAFIGRVRAEEERDFRKAEPEAAAKRPQRRPRSWKSRSHMSSKGATSLRWRSKKRPLRSRW